MLLMTCTGARPGGSIWSDRTTQNYRHGNSRASSVLMTTLQALKDQLKGGPRKKKTKS